MQENMRFSLQTPVGCRFRMAQGSDVPAVLRLVQSGFADQPSYFERTEALILNWAKGSGTLMLEHDETLIGCIVAGPDWSDPNLGMLSGLLVADAMRGRGYGSALVRAGLYVLAQGGFELARVRVQPAWIPAIRTLLRAGFEPDPWMPLHSEVWATILADPAVRQNRAA